MSEQKKAKQAEQILLSSKIQSPEVCSKSFPDQEELFIFVDNDTRSRAEIFESLKNRIKKDSAGTLDDSEAIEAARNLLGFFELLSGQQSKKDLNNVDKQRVNGNVTISKK